MHSTFIDIFIIQVSFFLSICCAQIHWRREIHIPAQPPTTQKASASYTSPAATQSNSGIKTNHKSWTQWKQFKEDAVRLSDEIRAKKASHHLKTGAMGRWGIMQDTGRERVGILPQYNNQGKAEAPSKRQNGDRRV